MSGGTSARETPELSVVVPAYNEEMLLESTVRSLLDALAACEISSEVIVVNDGSRDRTASIADALSAEFGSVRVCHQPNQGIGGAFRTGAGIAAGQYVMLWPADMMASRDDIAPYVSEIDRADVIVGCRRHRVGYNPFMLLNSWIYPRLVGLLFGLHLRDVNWIHAYRTGKFLCITLTQRGIPMLAEALVRLRDAGASFAEVDVVMKPRTGGVASASRIVVMWRTLLGLFSFWRIWRKEMK